MGAGELTGISAAAVVIELIAFSSVIASDFSDIAMMACTCSYREMQRWSKYRWSSQVGKPD